MEKKNNKIKWKRKTTKTIAAAATIKKVIATTSTTKTIWLLELDRLVSCTSLGTLQQQHHEIEKE